MDSRGNTFYKQKRFGKDKKLFECYKYRTMYENSNEILKNYLQENPNEIDFYEKYHKYENDPRITPVGKFLRKTSFDELPQFLNILKGEMSLIGPRPYSLDERAKIGDSLDIISMVRPGITGFWQVNGRNSLTFKKRVALEQWYVTHWSSCLDVVIFIKTFYILLFTRSK
jgi:undecaprenyl-phosphate galactose phosphotransferase